MGALNQEYPPSAGWIWDSVVKHLSETGETHRNTQAAWLTTIDVKLLAMCDAFIGQMSTNVFRTAYEQHASDCGCAAPFTSLDAPWCFDWPLHVQRDPVTNKTLVC